MWWATARYMWICPPVQGPVGSVSPLPREQVDNFNTPKGCMEDNLENYGQPLFNSCRKKMVMIILPLPSPHFICKVAVWECGKQTATVTIVGKH